MSDLSDSNANHPLQLQEDLCNVFEKGSVFVTEWSWMY